MTKDQLTEILVRAAIEKRLANLTFFQFGQAIQALDAAERDALVASIRLKQTAFCEIIGAAVMRRVELLARADVTAALADDTLSMAELLALTE